MVTWQDMSPAFKIYDKAKTKSFYDRFYQGRDFVQFPLADRFFIRAFFNKVQLPSGARILDLACGTGKYTHLLAAGGMRAVGIDFSEQGIHVARRRYPGVPFMVGDVLDLPFQVGCFDAVLCSGLSLFNEPDLSVLLPFVQRTATFLKTGGWFVFVKTTALTDRPNRRATRLDYSLKSYKEFFQSVDNLEIVNTAAVYPHLFVIFGQRAFDDARVTRVSSTVARLTHIPVRVYLILKKRQP